MRATDKVHVGSITKTIIALGLMELGTKGKLRLDDPVKKYLPEVPFQNPWENTNPVTIQHLLDHTAGLSDLRLWHFFSTSSTPSTPLSEFYKVDPKVLTINTRPGKIFSYSNMGYTLLGMIIEKVTNQPYEKYLDENLLPALGMLQSTFQFTSQIGRYKDTNLAMGHFDDGSIAPALPIYLRPAGQFTTTATDMGKLIQFMLHKGTLNNRLIIDSSYFSKLGNPIHTAAYLNGLQGGYALGISQRDRHGVIGLAHSGNIVGYHAMLYIFPDERKGFFISHNMDSESADYESFNKVLIDQLDLSKSPPLTTNQISETTEAYKDWNGYYAPVITKVEPFRLFDLMGSFTKIELLGNNMIHTPFQKNSTELEHLGNGIFKANGRLQASHLLYKEGDHKFLTTGINTLQKTSGLVIVTVIVSMLLGLVGVIGITISGIVQFFNYKTRFFSKPIFPAFTGIVLLLISIILIASNNIIYIGDKNFGTLFLFISSCVTPILVLLSLIMFFRSGIATIKNFGFWFVILLLQTIILLIIYKVIPFSTWS